LNSRTLRDHQMLSKTYRIVASFVSFLLLTACFAVAQQSPTFVPGNLIVVVEGCGVHGGSCTAVPNGSGTGAGNSSVTGYGDNQAAPLTLFQYAPNGTTNVTYVNSLVLPQVATGANLPVSGEYGSSSEGGLQLSGSSQYLTLMGYGLDAKTFNAAYHSGFTSDPFGAAPSGALAQSGSLSGQSYTPVPRVITLVDPYGNVNSATALYNVFNTNNPRSIYTADGVTSAYVSGQGSGCDATGGVFFTPLGTMNKAPKAITGIDASASSSCSTSLAQDTRNVQIYNNTLYVSVDSTEGKSFNRSFIGTLGTPPATSLYTPPSAFPYATGPTMLNGFGNTGGTGKVSITAGNSNNGNGLNTGLQVNLSPMGFFFASPSVLYVADGGSPKQTSATSLLGDGGLQKWTNTAPDGSGTWSLAYTLAKGLNLVQNPASNTANVSGATGLYGLAGTVSGGNVYLYATNYNIADLDPTYLYGITDALSATTNPGSTFTQLDAAPSDSNFKGLAFAPSLPAGSATITSSPSGFSFTTAGAGCVPGSYTTPVTLLWTPGSSCTLTVTSPVPGATGIQYTLAQWQDGTTGTTDTVTAPSTSAVYKATFNTSYLLTTAAGTGGTVSAGGFYTAGSNATVTATPSAGFVFVNFTGSVTATANPLTIAMTGPQSVTANFTPLITPTLSFAPIATQVVGAAPFIVTASSASTGAVTYAVASGPATISGNQVTVTGSGTVVLTATQAAVGNFTAATTTTSFMVVQPFTLSASASTSATVAAGSAAVFTLAVTPAAGTTIPHTITFSATGLPVNAAAVFSPFTVPAGSGVTPVSVSIQTANTHAALIEQPQPGKTMATLALGFLLLPLLGLKGKRRLLRQMSPFSMILLTGLLLGVVLGVSGCSSTPPATTPQSFTVVVTATDSTTKVQSSTNLALTVQ
jgi:hypothetical protein